MKFFFLFVITIFLIVLDISASLSIYPIIDETRTTIKGCRWRYNYAFRSLIRVKKISTEDTESSEALDFAPAAGNNVYKTAGKDVYNNDIVSPKMKIIAKQTVSTPPLRFSRHEIHRLNDFFRQDVHRNLLFLRNEVANAPDPSQMQIQIWSDQAKLAGGSSDFSTQSSCEYNQLLKMKASMHLPGLEIISVTTIGAKLLTSNPYDANSTGLLPEYQFTLIDSQLTPQGAAPLVWIFKQLIRYRDSTSSFTTVRAEYVDEGYAGTIVFTTEARLETQIAIPQLAVRILSIDLEKYEKQASAAFQSFLSKELEPALFAFRDAYLDWISSKEHTQTVNE